MRVAFLASFEHDIHLGFADAIDADVFHFRDTYSGPGERTPLGDAVAAARWPDYDVYVIEGSAPLYAAATRAAIDDAVIFYLGGDRGMYALSPASERTAEDPLFDSLLKSVGRPAVRAVARRTIDGAIVVSDFVADYTRAVVGPEVPIRVAHPYIDPDTFRRLQAVEPDLSSPVAVTVGRAMWYKGIDRLVEAWPRVREAYEEAELHVVGPGDHPPDYEDVPGVKVRGYVDDLSEAFEPASLFVQPSRGDAFPISTVEAMLAGVPALVTASAGVRSEVRAVDGDLVVDSSTNAIAEGVVRYFNNSVEERRELSNQAYQRGIRFDAPTRKRVFRKSFNSITKHIHKSEIIQL